jgi:hypothetical protein
VKLHTFDFRLCHPVRLTITSSTNENAQFHIFPPTSPCKGIRNSVRKIPNFLRNKKVITVTVTKQIIPPHFKINHTHTHPPSPLSAFVSGPSSQPKPSEKHLTEIQNKTRFYFCPHNINNREKQTNSNRMKKNCLRAVVTPRSCGFSFNTTK